MTAGKREDDITDLELVLLAVLAINHPAPVDAIDAFKALWELKRFPDSSMSEAMQLLVIAASAIEERLYATSREKDGITFYELTPKGAALFTGRAGELVKDISTLPGAELIRGRKPC